MRKAWKKWTDVNYRQIVLQRSLKPFLVASRLALNSCYHRKSFRMGGRQVTRTYSNSFLMNFAYRDEENCEGIARAFHHWAEVSRELSRRGRALLKILVHIRKLNLNRGLREWQRATWIIGREEENRNTTLLEIYNR